VSLDGQVGRFGRNYQLSEAQRNAVGISVTQISSEVVLLEVHHLVHERRQRVLRRTLVEVLRVERDLIGGRVIDPVLEPVVCEVTERIRATLEGHQAGRQCAAE
jgi:hypothetical protein